MPKKKLLTDAERLIARIPYPAFRTILADLLLEKTARQRYEMPRWALRDVCVWFEKAAVFAKKNRLLPADAFGPLLKEDECEKIEYAGNPVSGEPSRSDSDTAALRRRFMRQSSGGASKRGRRGPPSNRPRTTAGSDAPTSDPSGGTAGCGPTPTSEPVSVPPAA